MGHGEFSNNRRWVVALVLGPSFSWVRRSAGRRLPTAEKGRRCYSDVIEFPMLITGGGITGGGF
jgi:hypothetical protein